jgi:NAD(P)-dependent dehydrogenase (short-subunit alcohol dehydrogenase family)
MLHLPPPPAAETAAYAAEKASINVLMESLDVELNITGHSGIIAQSMVIG